MSCNNMSYLVVGIFCTVFPAKVQRTEVDETTVANISLHLRRQSCRSGPWFSEPVHHAVVVAESFTSGSVRGATSCHLPGKPVAPHHLPRYGIRSH